MKKLLFLLILLTSGFANAQQKLQLDTANKSLYLEAVMKFDSLKAEQIYSATKSWFGENFKSAKEVITSDNKEGGVIVARYISTYSMVGTNARFYNVMKVYIKDGKAKIHISSIENAEHDYSLESYVLKKDNTFRGMYSGLVRDVETNGSNLISSYEKYVTGFKKGKKDEW